MHTEPNTVRNFGDNLDWYGMLEEKIDDLHKILKIAGWKRIVGRAETIPRRWMKVSFELCIWATTHKEV